jgi:CDP-diacylglycerol---glycerol-3-phosphate 3-phosphatidyltransferase
MKKSIYRHIPNILTFIRIFGSCFIFFWMIQQSFWLGYGKMLFLIGLLWTDWLDGFLARRYQWISPLWKILDPIADKILLNGIMIAMIVLPELRLPWFLVGLILFREIGITLWRIMLANRGAIIPADTSWKIKTILQSILCILGCVWIFGIRHHYWPMNRFIWMGLMGLFYTIVLITLVSGIIILWKFYFQKKTLTIPRK